MAEPTSLFGPSALEARRASDLDFEARTQAQAKLDPRGRSYASQVNSARRVGRGINTLLGGQSTDPELRRAEIMDAAFKTLSPEELKNPAMALSTIADLLEEQNLPRDAAEARIKSISIAQQMTANENKVINDNIKTDQAKLENVARAASSALTVFNDAPDDLDMQETVYNNFADVQERMFGPEVGAKIRAVKPSARKVFLQSAIDGADKESSRNKEQLAETRANSLMAVAKFKADQDAIKTDLIESNKFKLQANSLRQKDRAEYNRVLKNRVDNLTKRIAIEQDNLELYSDPAKSPTLSESLRITNKNITNQNIATLKKELNDYGSLQMAAGERVYTPLETYTPSTQVPATSTAAAGGATSTTSTNKTEYETNFATVQAALKNPKYNATALLAEFKAKYPDQPQPDGSGAAATVTPTPGATPAAVAPAAVVPPKPQTEAERREQIFLDRLNDRTPLEVIQDVGSAIAGGFQQGEKYFQDKRDAFNKDIDIAASVAKDKLKDKTFVSNLSERQLKRLNEIANDSGAKHKAYQDSDTPYDALPLAGLSNVITKSASNILNKGSKILAAKAVRDVTRTPSDIENNMVGLQDRLKRVEELERARKLRQIGDSDKKVLQQIKEEIKLMDQANESALKESLKNAETAAARKLAMEQRKRLADIRKEIKRVFSIAGSTTVPYKKPQFD